MRLLDLGNDPGRGRVGAALVAGHEYRGSDERRTRLFPLLDYQWTSGWFASVSNGIGYAFENRRDLHWGPRMTADFGREEDSSPALRGLGDVNARTDAGAGLRDVRASATLLHAIDRRVALTATLGVSSLRGDAATSPVTRKKTAASGVATFTYAF